MRTLQGQFDKIVEHLATQKTRAMSGNAEVCAYQAHDDKSCAVGCLVDDDTAAKMDHLGMSVNSQDVWNLAKDQIGIDSLSDYGQTFYFYTQSAHDMSIDLNDLKGRLDRLAVKYGLDPSKIDLITEWTR